MQRVHVFKVDRYYWYVKNEDLTPLAFHKFSFELSDIKGMCLWENWILKATHYEKCIEEDVP